MPPLRFARAETSVGPMLVAETDLGLAAVTGSDAVAPFLASLQRRFPGSEILPADVELGWLDDALVGRDVTLPPIDARGLSAFDARVYQVVRSIPRGETMTYGEVAALIGSAGAARAVGGAMSRCPLFPAIPCHRVVRAADGWSGWGADDAFKLRLLRLEGRR
jgi:O-6-methylguanine DNA methyltransferase